MINILEYYIQFKFIIIELIKFTWEKKGYLPSTNRAISAWNIVCQGWIEISRNLQVIPIVGVICRPVSVYMKCW